MKIITDPAAASAALRAVTARRVLVPTMGALHRGHRELIRLARATAGDDGEVVVSIFVNPLQFAPGGDYAKYPRTEAADEALCREAGVNLLFRPSPAEMYPEKPSVLVEETELAETLCGKSRPGHFRGVCTVVAKLFHLLHPDVAVFGEKDFQQLAVIRRLVRDLNFNVEILAAPTVREADGLACSSRNQYLNPAERASAPVLRFALLAAEASALLGENSSATILGKVRSMIASTPLARLDYAEIVDAENLRPLEFLREPAQLAVAVFFGDTRLIDNIRLR